MILKRHLKISNWKELFIRDQLGLVKEIVKASLINFPFQNVTNFGAFLPMERKTPGFKKVLDGSLRGEGGLCGHLNNYMKFQLESLGYNVELVGGCFRRSGIPLSHFCVKVKLPAHALKESGKYPKSDKSYLVDVGCGIPLHEPVCLEELPYRGRAAGLNFRFEWMDDGSIQRVNENGDALMGEKPSDFISPQDYTIDMSPRKFSDFSEAVHTVFSNPRSVYLHQGLYCHRYLDITADDFQIVCIRGTELMFITKETRQVQSFSSYKDIQPTLLKYFPMISPRDIELAVKHFSIPFEEALKMSSKQLIHS